MKERIEIDTKCGEHPVDCLGCGRCPEPDEYISPIDCVRQKTHLTDCDEDGFCNFCGHMDSIPEILIEEQS